MMTKEDRVMLKTYRTVRGYGQNELVIDKSRFIAYVNRAEDEAAAFDFIESIRKKHRDATHNCSAYIIGEHDEHQKANDDGEPSGTAGVPMLEILKKMNVKNTVVVVTRYFGGIKLGAGGLIRAYSKAAKRGVLAAGVIERSIHRQILITVDYTWHGKLENEFQTNGIIIQDTQFSDRVTFTVLIEEGKETAFEQHLVNLTSGQAVIKRGKTEYVDRKVEVGA